MDELIKKCFDEHVKDLVNVYFSFEEYKQFWLDHNINNTYEMVNKDRSVLICKIAYYPLPYYKDLRALIEIVHEDWSDFRDVPIKFLNKII